MNLFRNRLLRYVEDLRFPYLVALAATLFLVNLVVPDALPFIDEILLAVVTLILSRVKQRRPPLPKE
jgi:hypothetical protein